MKKILIFSLLVISISSVTILLNTDNAKVTAKNLDMSNLKDVQDKKKRFFDFMRPIVIAENAEILNLRGQLIEARKNSNNKALVIKTAEHYGVDWDKKNWTRGNWDKLLQRVDAVALELVLAQSANESAWGQSKFATQGNNFFGQWCYKKGCGMVPSKRNPGSKHEVASFESVNDSVRSYLENINTGRVYAPLRQARENDRTAGKPPSAYNQAGGLVKYSERREEYVKEIRSMVRVNTKLILGV